MKRLASLALSVAVLTAGWTGTARASDHLERRAEYVPIVYEAAAYYGQNGAEMTRVIDCETGQKWEPTLVSPTNDFGLAQIHVYPDSAGRIHEYGPSLLDRTPYAGGSLFDPVTSVYAMAYLWSQGYQSHWACY